MNPQENSGQRRLYGRFQSARGLAQSTTWRTSTCHITREELWTAVATSRIGVHAGLIGLRIGKVCFDLRPTAIEIDSGTFQ